MPRISRRKLLLASGAVGAASLGAGLGTSAYFSDEESFTNNSFTAGELDLKVDYQNLYWGPPSGTGTYGSAGQPYVSAYPDTDDDGVRDGTDSPGDDDDVAQPLVELSDLKPGDSGCLEVGLELVDNPGYVCVGGSLEESENGLTEPEAEVDGSPNEGELAEAIEATLFYDDGCDAVSTNGCEHGPDDQVLATGTLEEVFDTLSEGHLLNDGEDLCISGGERHCLVLDWELPADVGNAVQSDGVTFGLTFYTEQCRHNEDPFSGAEDMPCASTPVDHGTCPDETLFAKYEWENCGFVFEKGASGGTAITIENITYKDQCEPIAFDWESSTEVTSITVFAGGSTATFDGGTSGTVDLEAAGVENAGGQTPAISHVEFCPP